MLKKTHDYDDIINCPRPDQSKRGGIKVDERAELFASFEALNSPDEILDENATELFCESELDEKKLSDFDIRKLKRKSGKS